MTLEQDRNGPEKADFFPSPEALRRELEASPYQDEILGFLARNKVAVETLLTWPERKSFYLSDLGILRHFLAGNIVIHPLNINRLTPNSYEVSLGENFFRQEQKIDLQEIYESPHHLLRGLSALPEKRFETALPIFNPFDFRNMEYVWRKVKPVRVADLILEKGLSLEGVDPEDEILLLGPHEMVLAHTQEFIGGRNVVSTMISARSSVGRGLLEVCNDANLGHVGFINRWTLEIRNKSDGFAIPLVVGQAYAQISFLETEPAAQSYQGAYQENSDLEAIIASWKPENMLPKMRRR